MLRFIMIVFCKTKINCRLRNIESPQIASMDHIMEPAPKRSEIEPIKVGFTVKASRFAPHITSCSILLDYEKYDFSVIA